MSVPASPVDVGDTARVFTPARWRRRAAWIIVALTALGGIPSAFIITTNPIEWRVAVGVAWLFTLPLPLYSAAMTRRIRVIPGRSISFRGLLFATRVIPVDATTEIVRYSDVDPFETRPGRAKRRKAAPFRVINQQWAVIRSQGRTVTRLSTWYWSDGQLLDLAMAAPAQLRLQSETTDVAEIERLYPDYYAPIERHPALEGWLFGIAITLAAIAVLLGFGSLFELAPALWPAPR